MQTEQKYNNNGREFPPMIGEKAPGFIAESTQGVIHFPEDYQGKWVILFSHPSDFSPVCTTEFISFAQMQNRFLDLNTELIGLSVDSLSSHIAWLYAIQEQVRFHGLSHIRISFPLIADVSRTIAERYGMVHPQVSSVKAVRSVYVIDAKGIIRAVLHYPPETGRNFKELFRILISLQTMDAFGVLTPADWEPGDDVIQSVPDTLDTAVRAAESNKNESGAWFLNMKKLPKEQIVRKLKRHKK